MNAIPDQSPLLSRFNEVRQRTLDLCAPLEVEDYQIQPMADASPPKWHLAHVTWFFETFLLKPELAKYRPFDDSFEVLFNSYYNGIGKPYPRARRGHLSRPTLQRIFEYREYVDAAMAQLLDRTLSSEIRFRVELGLHHEQQHQELILTDLKYNLGNNPLKPAYVAQPATADQEVDPLGFQTIEGGLVRVGSDGSSGFTFDNETPQHQVFLHPYELANRAVTNGEFIRFIEDGGYERSDLWLSDGWSWIQGSGTRLPLYWRLENEEYHQYQLGGEVVVRANEPVVHISGYEADAYARWSGARLPTEAEWEHAVQEIEVEGNFVERSRYHPAAQTGSGLVGMYGDVWEWTQSAYGPYPGFQPFAGQVGEYNGKFMANQLVLRGGSCATPASHIRSSYRNFFYPPDRWQFSGLRLARNRN